MTLESRREKVIYLGLVPVVAAILGSLATAIFQIAATPSSEFPTAIEILKDPLLGNAEKVKLLEMVKEIGDRPWSVIRTLTTSLTFIVGVCAIPLAQRIRDR
jgi:hypothetical protein